MFSKRDMLDRIAQYQAGRTILRFIVRRGVAVETIDDALAREIKWAGAANR
jgi:hypothetical protein